MENKRRIKSIILHLEIRTEHLMLLFLRNHHQVIYTKRRVRVRIAVGVFST